MTLTNPTPYYALYNIQQCALRDTDQYRTFEEAQHQAKYHNSHASFPYIRVVKVATTLVWAT